MPPLKRTSDALVAPHSGDEAALAFVGVLMVMVAPHSGDEAENAAFVAF